MVGKVLVIDKMIAPDQLGVRIAEFFRTWKSFRSEKERAWEELRKFVYATDTTTTSVAHLPWKNKTTLPKLCQIRDNLYANYRLALFPKRNWVVWEGSDPQSEDKQKRLAIQDYMDWVLDQRDIKLEIDKLLLDYIDYGNCFGTVEWVDDTHVTADKTKTGYVGPTIRRINPLDIVFNPIAPSFEESPKIIRSLVSLGEVKELMEVNSGGDPMWKDLYDYLYQFRTQARNFTGELRLENEMMAVDGFTDYRSYLESDYVELLTAYGDFYDAQSDTLLKNHMIVVADRHKIIVKKTEESFFANPPIFHVGWRKRQDNLWAMGPLDNLVGLQYRIDHLENLKADVFDVVAFPVLKIKGYVEDFEWAPFARIFVGDEGDVELLSPDAQALNSDMQIALLEQKMEEMAGAPKEAMGFRTPGEKTMYEVQRLENAAARIFHSKILQFEEQEVEPLLNAMLELARRRMSDAVQIRSVDEEFKIAVFATLGPQDITGNGRIRPVAAKHFAEKAEQIQNLSNFANTPLYADQAINVHMSGLQIAKLLEELLQLEKYKVVEPFIRITEMADAQRMQNSSQESVAMEAMTPSGLAQDDVDPTMEMVPPGV